jgi:hypothetical protein
VFVLYTSGMFLQFFPDFAHLARAAIARQLHSYWLSRAVRSNRAMPRIPTRRVSEGGFDVVTATPAGRAWAEEWWAQTLQSSELDL